MQVHWILLIIKPTICWIDETSTMQYNTLGRPLRLANPYRNMHHRKCHPAARETVKRGLVDGSGLLNVLLFLVDQSIINKRRSKTQGSLPRQTSRRGVARISPTMAEG